MLLLVHTEGDPAQCQALIAAGVSPDALDETVGETALLGASVEGHHSVCELLLKEHSANTELVDPSSCTPLMRAAEHGHASIVELLLSHGADPAKKDANGFNAAAKAQREGHGRLSVRLAEAEEDAQFRPRSRN